MGVATPEDMAETFVQRFNDRDAAGMLALYAPEAIFTMDGETYARGTGEIKGVIDQLLSAPSTMKGKYDSVLVAGDTAVCKLRWELLDGEGWISMDGVSMEVLRRGGDGKWRFIIDDATGTSRAAE